MYLLSVGNKLCNVVFAFSDDRDDNYNILGFLVYVSC
jgi:hypothetical protein